MGGLQRHLVVMARAPRLGRVKRRLARDVGALEALRFYRSHTAALLRDLSDDPRWRLWLALTPDRALRAPVPWRFHGTMVAQGGGDLGRRMGRLFECLPPGPLVMIGSDIPGITRGHITRAFQALGACDWVFGPAEDGGYWLVGARRRPRIATPFDDVRWSTAHTLGDTLANLAGQRVACLETLRDVDSGADLAALRRETPVTGRWRSPPGAS